VIIGRGGSERVPRKNVRTFCDKPMIYWPIKAIQASECFGQIIVSTDDEEISRVAMLHGVDAPFMRPEQLSNSSASTLVVVRHALRWLAENRGVSPRITCCAYAATPFITKDTVRRAMQLVDDQSVDYVFPVIPYSHPVQRAFSLDPSGKISLFQSDKVLARTQDLTPSFHDAGQFYCARTEVWLDGKEILMADSYGIPVSPWEACDIDTLDDWRLAEKLFSLCKPQSSLE
jgi:pseudaminic acid cytidylyltransferase